MKAPRLSGPPPLPLALAQHAGSSRIRTGAERSTARLCLLTSLASILTATAQDPRPRPLLPGAVMPGGARVPGTSLELDPVQAAFVIGALVTGHSGTPVDDNSVGPEAAAGPLAAARPHVGALLAVADYLARQALMEARPPLTVGDLLECLLTSHEIQLALGPLDPPLQGAGCPSLLLKIALCAVLTARLGGNLTQIVSSVTQALRDGPALPLPPHAPRSRWATADAGSRAVRLALLSLADKPAYEPDEQDEWGSRTLRGFSLPRLRVSAAEENTVRLQLTAAAEGAFRPRQVERIKTLLTAPLESLDAWPVSSLMAHLVTHAVRESVPQLALPLV